MMMQQKQGHYLHSYQDEIRPYPSAILLSRKKDRCPCPDHTEFLHQPSFHNEGIQNLANYCSGHSISYKKATSEFQNTARPHHSSSNHR